MATYRGMDGTVKAVATGGTPSTALGEMTGYTLNITTTLLEDTAAGDASRTRKAGLKDWSASVELHFDPDDAIADLLVEGAAVKCEFEVNETDGSTEQANWSGECLVESISISSAIDGLVTYSANLQGNGTLTRTDA